MIRSTARRSNHDGRTEPKIGDSGLRDAVALAWRSHGGSLDESRGSMVRALQPAYRSVAQVRPRRRSIGGENLAVAGNSFVIDDKGERGHLGST
jgi:hypothetical protein